MHEHTSGLTAEGIFTRFFRALYPPALQGDLSEARSRDANAGNNPQIIAQLDAIATTFAKLAPEVLKAPELSLDRSDASVHQLAALLTRARRDELLAPPEKTDEPPPLVHLVTHGAVYLGACAVKNHGGSWQVRNPLWESRVELRSRAGVGQIAMFQWWLKALSDDEIGQPRLADRYRLHVEMPDAKPERLPLIAPPERKLPRLKKVRYDTMHKYLRAHLPELKSVGDHFPSPERFAELSFRWLDFLLLGEGRMLLLHGPGKGGVHMLWLTMDGFASAAFFPSDPDCEHQLSVNGDALHIDLVVAGASQQQELLWWGAG